LRPARRWRLRCVHCGRSAHARIIVGVPVASPEAAKRVAEVADEVVCVMTPASFGAVGECYKDFGQTSDAEVTRLLAPCSWPVAKARRQAGRDNLACAKEQRMTHSLGSARRQDRRVHWHRRTGRTRPDAPCDGQSGTRAARPQSFYRRHRAFLRWHLAQQPGRLARELHRKRAVRADGRRVRISDDAGRSWTFGPGDCFVMPSGFRGLWEVLEPARKFYAIYEPGT
jgi:hypothetical protein